MPDALGHIMPGDINLAYPAPGFGDLVAGELGNAGGPDDGFDAAYAQTVSDLDTLLTLLDAIDFILGIGTLLGDPTGESILIEATPQMQANIDASNADYAALAALALEVGLTPPSLQPPSTTGSSGAPNPGPALVVTPENPVASSTISVQPVGNVSEWPLAFTNDTGKDITIEPTKLVSAPSGAGVWDAAGNLTIQAGATALLATMTITILQAGVTQVVAYAQDVDSGRTYEWNVEITEGNPGGGGEPGGGAPPEPVQRNQ